MRPLTAGARESVRPAGMRRGAVVVVVLAVAALVSLVLHIPLPDQDARIGTAYVTRTSTGFEVGFRACAHQLVRHADVRVYGLEPVVWSTSAEPGTPGRTTLPLFQEVPGFTSTETAPEQPTGLYDADPGAVFPATLPVGFVAYSGADEPITMKQYLELSDAPFDC